MTKSENLTAILDAMDSEKPVKVYLKNRVAIGMFVSVSDSADLANKNMFRFVYNYDYENFVESNRRDVYSKIFLLDFITQIIPITHDLL